MSDETHQATAKAIKQADHHAHTAVCPACGRHLAVAVKDGDQVSDQVSQAHCLCGAVVQLRIG